MVRRIDTGAVRLEDECPIVPGERDRTLLSAGGWPEVELPEEWEMDPSGGAKSRELELVGYDATEEQKVQTELLETVLRFPSAPIIATHNAPAHGHFLTERWPSYHTMRLLKTKRAAQEGDPVRHVFLLHNGLNETDDMSFHYLLANWILAERDDAVCILRPLPGHLTRYPFQGPFSERPLDEYLRDPGSVFRQYLRFMLESRWLLSALVTRPTYEVMTGCELLLDAIRADVPSGEDRSNPEALAREIARQGNEMLAASRRRARKEQTITRVEATEGLDHAVVQEAIEELRGQVGWSPTDAEETPSLPGFEYPAIHVVGYSMGGFFAQSVFCTWPFAIASCSNFFAGGALRNLAPTAFAHPEEWQSVLHGLRSELDQARIDQFHTPGPSPNGTGPIVLGVEREVFDYIDRVFRDVFLQDDYGSYSTRLEEFSRRLLFILGGDDPIVRTRNVLDAAPPGGITMQQIGDVSHFPSNHTRQPVEKEQRDFWLPEACGTIGRFAERAAYLLQRTHHEHWGFPAKADSGSASAPGQKARRKPARAKRSPDRALSNVAFEDELDLMVSMCEEQRGWLFVARNQMPTVFLDEADFPFHGAAMHHSEDNIGIYVESLQKRAARLHVAAPRLTLLIPATYAWATTGNSIGERAKERARLAKSEVAIRYASTGKEPGARAGDEWGDFVAKWCTKGSVRLVDAGEYRAEDLGAIGRAWLEGRESTEPEETISMTMLPDLWMALSQEAGTKLLGVTPDAERDVVELAMLNLACDLAREPIELKGHFKAHSKLQDALSAGSIRAVKVSAAELNPRFRGRQIEATPAGERKMANLLIHWAMAYAASERVAVPEPG